MKQNAIRVSDAEREAVVARLADAVHDGRLDLAEYDRRLTEVNAVSTLGELDRLHADLPRSARERAQTELREWHDELGYFAGGAVIMTAIWGVTSLAHGEPEFYWPVFPIVIWALILISYAIWPRRET